VVLRKGFATDPKCHRKLVKSFNREVSDLSCNLSSLDALGGELGRTRVGISTTQTVTADICEGEMAWNQPGPAPRSLGISEIPDWQLFTFSVKCCPLPWSQDICCCLLHPGCREPTPSDG
jgi:hypothetical protein